MPIIEDTEYDALLYVARSIELGHKPIEFDVPEIQAYEDTCKSGTTLKIDGETDEEKKKREANAKGSRRFRLKTKASKYTVGVGEGRKVLLKKGKPVLRKDQYTDILLRFHDENSHIGSKKLRCVVSI